MVVLIILFSFILSKTKFGTYVYAIGGNREAARLSGVPIKKIEIIVFTISGLLSAFAGLVLCSRMYSGQPSVGSGYELDAIAACVLGGTSMTSKRRNLQQTSRKRGLIIWRFLESCPSRIPREMQYLSTTRANIIYSH